MATKSESSVGGAVYLMVGVELEFLFGYVEDPNGKDPWGEGNLSPFGGMLRRPPLHRSRPPSEFSSESEYLSAWESDILHAVKHAVEGSAIERLKKANRPGLVDGMYTYSSEDHHMPTLWKNTYIIKPEILNDGYQVKLADGMYSMMGVEVTTPIFATTKERWLTDRADTIEYVTQDIKTMCRVLVNSSCGLHVHVGLDNERKYTQLDIKRLATLLWFVEDCLYQLCSEKRRLSEEGGPNVFCAEMTRYSKLAKLSGRLLDSQYEAAAALLGQAGSSVPDYAQFQEWVKPALEASNAADDTKKRLAVLWALDGRASTASWLYVGGRDGIHRLGFNFLPLWEELEKETVEFRIMDGTLNHFLINNWISVCRSVMLASFNLTNERFADVLISAASGDHSVFQIMKKMFCHDGTIQYFQQRLARKPEDRACADQSDASIGGFCPPNCLVHPPHKFPNGC